MRAWGALSGCIKEGIGRKKREKEGKEGSVRWFIGLVAEPAVQGVVQQKAGADVTDQEGERKHPPLVLAPGEGAVNDTPREPFTPSFLFPLPSSPSFAAALMLSLPLSSTSLPARLHPASPGHGCHRGGLG